MKRFLIFLLCFLVTFCLVVGCDSKNNNSENKQGDQNKAHHHKDHKKWCEHGFEKGNCYQCDPKLAEKFKKSGDWCKGHNVPESQCFPCNEGLQEKVNKRLAQNKHDGHEHKNHDHDK